MRQPLLVTIIVIKDVVNIIEFVSLFAPVLPFGSGVSTG